MQNKAVELTGITKAFGANDVLRGIDLTLSPGQVTVLMGANGAGKSTLVKILCGVHSANSGTITLDGEPFSPSSPSEAIRAGVVTVHQSINDGVILDLDIASNLMLDHLTAPGAGFFLNKRKHRAEARKIAAAMELNVDVTQSVSELGLADRQLVAIARAMAHRPKLLILDEPTSSLSAVEARRLFSLLDRLRDAGAAILYISHRMSDIRRIADRIVSMRDGKISGVFETSPLNYEGAVKAMLGHAMTDVDIDIPKVGAPVMRLSDISLRPGSKPFSLDLHANEVVAITGLVGSGKTDFADILFGLGQPVTGRMSLLGKPYHPASQRQAINAGVFLCPKDRASNAVVQDFDITRNITIPFLARHSAFSFLKRRSERATAGKTITDLGIVCQSDGDEIGRLSGGNQQKVMVGRWLSEASNLLVLDEPFQGVDIKARRDIGHKIRETAGGRATVVLVAEMDEALEIADRIIVMADHTIVGDHRNEDIDLGAVLTQVAGQQSETTDKTEYAI
ncbi:sugar ABC transporter ATP-binding protein [Parasedimentitalea psychrophila]|uniref:Sugar ABC transporter ATP-binding protein n=1 Tax=Parasedimentitalea psychrophila TaxID=2997337 RepID=A0A9Y2L1Q3_9RHOB|nr:sugar ABC transporter ATP-binding protein [Parasedimentitalea psychrophila]WIY25762.1 sugar ABC transporter ATP-binding protein [Parasedimentitalea psychrophila]